MMLKFNKEAASAAHACAIFSARPACYADFG
jgi:hypothetical protein